MAQNKGRGGCGFLSLHHSEQKWTAKMASKRDVNLFPVNQKKAIHFSSIIDPLLPQGL